MPSASCFGNLQLDICSWILAAVYLQLDICSWISAAGYMNLTFTGNVIDIGLYFATRFYVIPNCSLDDCLSPVVPSVHTMYVVWVVYVVRVMNVVYTNSHVRGMCNIYSACDNEPPSVDFATILTT